jgi:hypothetical protein
MGNKKCKNNFGRETAWKIATENDNIETDRWETGWRMLDQSGSGMYPIVGLGTVEPSQN